MAIKTIQREQELWFEITDFDTMRPFFMSVVSDSNHWLFISSNGGLTAGRKNNQFALFPYYTDDKLTDLADSTGSKTILKVFGGDGSDQSDKSSGTGIFGSEGPHYWEPFSDRYTDRYTLRRNLYKSFNGNKLLFEEINEELGLVFRYQWNTSHEYGFIRKAELENLTGGAKRIEILDGLQNLLPYGIEPELQSSSSNLADAYKRSELVSETGLGLYSLSAMITDKAEPSEALKANTVWSRGLEASGYLLSSLQLRHFREGKALKPETDVKGEKGAYFVWSTVSLGPNSTKRWMMVAEVNQSQTQVVALNERLKQEGAQGVEISVEIEKDIQRGTDRLRALVAAADGLRYTADTLKDARHFSSVMFNIMRGGIFDEHYTIEKPDLLRYLKQANREVLERSMALLDPLPDRFTKADLDAICEQCEDQDLFRLLREYLPLKFSRRHGDPSRPWNRFSINTYAEDGSKILDYEGNWRDIFQNWEALVHSYPDFIEGMLFKFLNASTCDGYNPYRVTKGGFDWEVIEPDNPWSYIGYWGDHQVIYLLKFLEFYQKVDAKALSALMDKACFVYANVPYRIRPYSQIVQDAKNTIDFDHALDTQLQERMASLGADGALVTMANGDICRVNFLEKVLVMILAKVSNFVPEGGIWMNTQRPEWNDANNALVGNGISMVTLYYLRRFLVFLEGFLDGDGVVAGTGNRDGVVAGDKSVREGAEGLGQIELSREVAGFFNQVYSVLASHSGIIEGSDSGGFTDEQRRLVTDALGEAGSAYRMRVYEHGFSGEKTTLHRSRLREFLHITRAFLEHSIRQNRRNDGLYHAYNLLHRNAKGLSVTHLSEMLEGQVAVLSSGYLSAAESLEVLQAMRASALYRPDQNSYILYPNRELPGFMEKNILPAEKVKNSALLSAMIRDGETSLVQQDVLGNVHFHGGFRNARHVREALHELASGPYAELAAKEEHYVLEVYEQVFQHKSFTGRSGTFFAYEGLGSIYWHMVSKLHLAVYECIESARSADADPAIVKALKTHFIEIGEGIGVHKTPEEYGAFPTDAYSHTPMHRGASQPGMTGQVKEDILVMFGVHGLRIENGQLRFDPLLLSKADLMPEEREVSFVSVNGSRKSIRVPAGGLAFSCCQVPVVYVPGDHETIEITDQNGTNRHFDGLELPEDVSRHLFLRTGEIDHLRVTLKPSRFM